jgi:hypothetical protein
VNVLVNKNAPFLRGGGDKLKYFVVVSVVSVVVVVVCCGDIDIDIDIIIDRTLLLLIINSYIFFVFFFSFCCFFFCGKVCLQNFKKENVKKKHACLASIIQNGIH